MLQHSQGSQISLFSGSYSLNDCQFLLKPLSMDSVSIADKESRIQSGINHYSEMLAPEVPPSPVYLTLFRELTVRHAQRIGEDIVSLAAHLLNSRRLPLTIVSLARAGTPIGALLARALRTLGAQHVRHYSISIIRDRGIDVNALWYILGSDHRPATGVVFVDGWTAKGVITRELRAAVAKWNRANQQQLDTRLYVLTDIGGTADVAASYEDYAIPSGILNATVSGLVSRSILNTQIGTKDFHGCVFYKDFAPWDQSTWFLDQIAAAFAVVSPRPINPAERKDRANATAKWLKQCLLVHRLRDINLIKPGVAEATRVLLRRVPQCLIVRDTREPDLNHLLQLAHERGVRIEIDPTLPFLAAAVIQSLRGSLGSIAELRSGEP